MKQKTLYTTPADQVIRIIAAASANGSLWAYFLLELHWSFPVATILVGALFFILTSPIQRMA